MPKTGRENWGEDQHLLTFFRGGKTKKQSILPWRDFPRARPAESLSSEASPGDGTGFVGKAAPGAQGHCGVSPARRPRSAATGAEQAAEGEVRDTHRPKLPFSGCSERREEKPKHRIQPETHPRGRAGCARGCGGGGGAGAFPPACRPAGNPPARREAGVEDARASPGAYK